MLREHQRGASLHCLATHGHTHVESNALSVVDERGARPRSAHALYGTALEPISTSGGVGVRAGDVAVNTVLCIYFSQRTQSRHQHERLTTCCGAQEVSEVLSGLAHTASKQTRSAIPMLSRRTSLGSGGRRASRHPGRIERRRTTPRRTARLLARSSRRTLGSIRCSLAAG